MDGSSKKQEQSKTSTEIKSVFSVDDFLSRLKRFAFYSFVVSVLLSAIGAYALYDAKKGQVFVSCVYPKVSFYLIPTKLMAYGSFALRPVKKLKLKTTYYYVPLKGLGLAKGDGSSMSTGILLRLEGKEVKDSYFVLNYPALKSSSLEEAKEFCTAVGGVYGGGGFCILKTNVCKTEKQGE